MDRISEINQKQTASLNFDMSRKLREHIDAQIAPKGDYNSAGEYVRDILRREMLLAEEKEISRLLLRSKQEDMYFEPGENYFKNVIDSSMKNIDV